MYFFISRNFTFNSFIKYFIIFSLTVRKIAFFSHISFHFTANNAGLARVVFESRNTGKSVRHGFTSGLGRVSINFSLTELPGTTEMNVLIYAYSTAGGDNETLHRMLYGNIPGVV